VARVAGVHGHGGVAEHGLRARCRHHNATRAVGQGVLDVPQVAVDFVVGHHFLVRDGRPIVRAPVDDVGPTVDEAVVVELAEDKTDGPGKPLIECEALARPVHAAAEALELLGDPCMVLVLPGPHLVDEPLAPQVVPADAVLRQVPLDHGLGGDAGMVGARKPQGLIPGHAVVARQQVHDGVLQGVAHVQGSGDVGGRDDDAVWRLPALHAWREHAVAEPAVVPARFGLARVVGIF